MLLVTTLVRSNMNRHVAKNMAMSDFFLNIHIIDSGITSRDVAKKMAEGGFGDDWSEMRISRMRARFGLKQQWIIPEGCGTENKIMKGINGLSIIGKTNRAVVASYLVTTQTWTFPALPVCWICGMDKDGAPCDFEITLGGPVKKELQIKAGGSDLAWMLPECNEKIVSVVDFVMEQVPGLKDRYLKSGAYTWSVDPHKVATISFLVLNVWKWRDNEPMLRYSGEASMLRQCDCTRAMARYGHTHAMVKAVSEGECVWHPDTLAAAAAHGNTETMQAAFENGCGWNDKTATYSAACGGYTETMLAAANIMGWDPKTTHAAASNGHTDCMLAAVKGGCPWSADTASVAISSGYLETAEAARKAGCPVLGEKQ